MTILRVVTAAVLLLLLWPLWGWLETRAAGAGAPNLLDGWMLAAYAIVFAALTGYQAWLADQGRVQPSGRQRPWLLRVLDQAAPFAFLVALVLVFAYAPREGTMGEVQRIFYVHVSSAWVAGLAFAVVFAGSVGYLARSSLAADRWAQASAEVGVLFTSIVLVTGPIWAKPVWGIWWTWDARLTMTLVLWLVYVGYLMLRAYLPEAERRARLAAVLGVLGFVGVPINYMAIRWWRTQHPQPVIAGGEGSGLEGRMMTAFLVMLVAFTLVYVRLLLARVETLRESS